MIEFKPGDRPKYKDQVICTFLKDNITATDLKYINDLGFKAIMNQYKKFFDVRSIPVDTTSIDKCTLLNDAVVVLSMSNELKHSLMGLRTMSDEIGILIDKYGNPYWDDKKLEALTQNYINILEKFIKEKYCEQYDLDITTVEAVCSRHLILRAAGQIFSNVIPGNPLFHLDYNSSDNAYSRQCVNQDMYIFQTHCPEKDNILDIVNIWFPTSEVVDWPLGFIPINHTSLINDFTIELVSSSQAASLTYKDEYNVMYKPNMTWGDVYMFRTSHINNNINKKGIYHGSFSISPEPKIRRSCKIRCLLFKKQRIQLKKSVSMI